MQARGGNQPDGIVYNTSMNRPDAALALAAFYAMTARRESKIGAVCVTGAGYETAVFCDIAARFYTGAAKNGNEMLAVGLAAVSPMPPDSAMVKAVVARKKDDGQPFYNRSITRITDTSQAEALLRNGVIFNATSVMILSAPATALARTLDLAGVRDVFKQRVRRLVIVESRDTASDAPALRKVAAEWPGPVFFVGRDVGESAPFAGGRLDEVLPGTHPIAEAYRAFQTMPYDSPSHDLAAMYYAVHPEAGFFKASEPGMISATTDGAGVRFTPGEGAVRRVSLDPTRQGEAIAALMQSAGSGAAAAPRGRG